MSASTANLASALLEAHEKLEAAFALHQEALLLGDSASAREMLRLYRGLLSVHMRHEEELLLPVFRRAGPIKKWPEVLYTGQHDKMNEHLGRIERALDGLETSSGRALRRELITLLDMEATYKHLVEHHDGAEREGLFPVLDEHQTDAEGQELIPRLLAEWRATVVRARPTYARIAEALDQRARRLDD
jgi:hemerythrin-like domain-containing protein